MRKIQIDQIELGLQSPLEMNSVWVGQAEAMQYLEAAWSVVEKGDLPMNPRLVGRPGVGKTSLACHVGRKLNREVYLFQATMDTRPEDLLIVPVLDGERKLRYSASSLVTAMIRGGVLILDEGNRMSEKAWASLAPLLDHRRYVESVLAGIRIQAHPDFLFCTTMNEDGSTFEIPEYIFSRLQPGIALDFPTRAEELQILKENLPMATPELLDYVANYLQKAHLRGASCSVRDGINIGRYAFKLLKTRNMELKAAFDESLSMILSKNERD